MFLRWPMAALCFSSHFRSLNYSGLALLNFQPPIAQRLEWESMASCLALALQYSNGSLASAFRCCGYVARPCITFFSSPKVLDFPQNSKYKLLRRFPVRGCIYIVVSIPLFFTTPQLMTAGALVSMNRSKPPPPLTTWALWGRFQPVLPTATPCSEGNTAKEQVRKQQRRMSCINLVHGAAAR